LGEAVYDGMFLTSGFVETTFEPGDLLFEAATDVGGVFLEEFFF
jgi:hypothetical protein